MFFLAHYNLAIFSHHVRKALHIVSLVLLVRRESKMLVLPVGKAAKSLPIDLTGVNIAFKVHHENGGKVCGLLGRVLSIGTLINWKIEIFIFTLPPRLNKLYLDNLKLKSSKRYSLHSPEQNT